MNTIIFHIGWMRTGSTYLQDIFQNNQQVSFSLKNRYFSFDEFYNQQTYMDRVINNNSSNLIHIDSDENYSLGRFKNKIINRSDKDFSLRSELANITHDIPKMVNRLYKSVPNAKIFGVIRRQDIWLKSIYKHDVESFGIDLSFDDFLESDLGDAYQCAGNYYFTYKMFLSCFGEANIKILLFEDLICQPEEFFEELSDFCEVKIGQRRETRKSKNASLTDFTIEILKNINKLSRKNPNKSEHYFYWFLRSNAIRFGRFLSVAPLLKNYQLKGTKYKKIMEQYGPYNKEISNIIQKKTQMKKHGYFS